MKTPEEIKRGLDCCANRADLYDGCSPCSYNGEKLICYELQIDALAYIQQLERDNAQKDERIRGLEREREALINILKKTDIVCLYCKYFCNGCTRVSREIRLNGDCFEWRGVEENET